MLPEKGNAYLKCQKLSIWTSLGFLEVLLLALYSVKCLEW